MWKLAPCLLAASCGTLTVPPRADLARDAATRDAPQGDAPGATSDLALHDAGLSDLAAPPDMAIRRLAPGQPIPADFAFDGYLAPGAVRSSPPATTHPYQHLTVREILVATTRLAVVCSFAAW